jgi:hypothetical protein
LHPNPRFGRGDRVRVNEKARRVYPDYVGMLGHIGIGSIAAKHFHHGQYYVTVVLPTKGRVILRLTEKQVDDATPDFRL